MTTPAVDYIIGGIVLVGEDLTPVRADLRIENGRIAEIAQPGSLERSLDAAVVDAGGAFVLPGFVDCHDHLWNLTPGLPVGEGLSLDDLLKVMWDLGLQMGATEYRLGAVLGSVQRLRAGITTVVDHAYTFHMEGLDEAVLGGLEEAGARSFYARGIMTRPYEPVSESWGQAATRIRALVDGGLVAPERLFVAPVSIRQATPDDYQRSVQLARDVGAGLYTHVAETAEEITIWKQETDATPIHALDRIGFLTDRTVLVHCVQLEPAEIDLLAERGSHVVHCPTNHMKLAKGFTPVPELLAAGVNVALGVDMMADMLGEIRSEVGMHAIHRRNPNAVDRLDVLRMAGRNGAHALQAGDWIGTIAAGRAADLAIIDGRNLDHGPVIDPHYSIVYTANSGMVRHVLVDGQHVIADGRCATVDEEALQMEVENVVGHYLRRIGVREHLWWH